MEVSLHKLARTTPAIRKEIQSSSLSASALAKKYGVSIATIYKWKKRTDVYDKSHTRHNLLSSLNSAEEELVKELREKLSLSIDDITEVMCRCLKKSFSRSSIFRCLKRLGVKKPSSKEAKQHKPFDISAAPGFIHVDVKYLTKLDGKRSYVYAAIDRFSRYVYVEILYDLKPETASQFLSRFVEHFPYKVETILSDNVPSQESSIICTKIYPFDRGGSFFLINLAQTKILSGFHRQGNFFHHSNTRSSINDASR